MINLKTRIIALVGMLCFSGLFAQDLHSIDQTILIQEDGSATILMDIQVNFPDSTDLINIPTEYADMVLTLVTLDGAQDGISVQLAYDRTSSIYKIQFENALIGLHNITLYSELAEFLNWEKAGPEEFKTYNWEVSYTNTLPVTMDRCGLTVILPSGWNYHRINGSDPKFKKKDPKPPYIFTVMEDKASVSISRAPMEYMQSVSIEFAFKNEHKPSILIYMGVILSLLYLYYFRHLVLNKDIKKSNDSSESKKEK